MAAVVFNPVPQSVVPVPLVKQLLGQVPQWLKSEAVNFDSTSGLTVFEVPANSLVVGAVCQISTVFNGGIPSLCLGISGTTELHIARQDIDVRATGFYPSPRPFHEYTAKGTIIATIVPDGATTGVAYFWLAVRLNSDRQYAR
jgi:hypothetical protein